MWDLKRIMSPYVQNDITGSFISNEVVFSEDELTFCLKQKEPSSDKNTTQLKIDLQKKINDIDEMSYQRLIEAALDIIKQNFDTFLLEQDLDFINKALNINEDILIDKFECVFFDLVEFKLKDLNDKSKKNESLNNFLKENKLDRDSLEDFQKWLGEGVEGTDLSDMYLYENFSINDENEIKIKQDMIDGICKKFNPEKLSSNLGGNIFGEFSLGKEGEGVKVINPGFLKYKEIMGILN